jgi:hypothetical protein
VDVSRVVTLIRELGRAHLSVLRATLQTPGSQVTIVTNTRNAAFWRALVDCGFAQELPWDPDLQLVRARWKTFALTHEGRLTLPQLLNAVWAEDEGAESRH